MSTSTATVINLPFEHCVNMLLALIIASCIGPGGEATVYGSSNFVTASYVALMALAWALLWFLTSRTESSSLDPVLNDEMKAGDENEKNERRSKRLLTLFAAVPLVLAVLKHGLSGNTLVSLSRHFDELIASTDPNIVAVNSSSSIPARHRRLRNPRRIADLPSADVVVAYYNEPVSYVRTMISRIRSELTWAYVDVVVYHQGISGFGQNGTRGVTEITEQLRRDTGADVVVPRENTGRDMGAYLQHIFAPYSLYVYPYDLGNSWPFTEIATVWDMFHSELPMPKGSPISITYNGQMLLSRATIRRTGREVWSETMKILVSEVDDPWHVPGFAWKAEEEG
ncbi:hypothetical protein QFC20_003826 [Naganishia adeliensis]|uniref:Uncharacterized protein n=1 Tax=Naganishia adeliensis TaxID=92952 RepID=A0ACC2W7U5_9TREE|nr:hypothetical protein QFC20_003826 [Naganishia adeliensis]